MVSVCGLSARNSPCCVTGKKKNIAACMYPIPDDIAEICDEILTDDLREIKDRFMEMIQ